MTSIPMPTPDLFSYTRFESVSRDPSLADGLAARVADPLWLLARQDTIGELSGTDAGSAVLTRLRAHSSRLTRLRAGAASTGPGQQLQPGGGPLETMIEAEAEPGSEPRPLFGAQAGLAYLRLLGQSAGTGDLSVYRAGLLAAYPFPAPQGVQPAQQVGQAPPLDVSQIDQYQALLPYVGRVPDGQALYAALSATVPGGTLPAAPPLGAANGATVLAIAQSWLAWYEAVAGVALAPEHCWAPERMEYAFSVAAPGPGAETILVSANNSTGEFQWYHCDLAASSIQPVAAGDTLGAVPSDLSGGDIPIDITAFPTAVRYRGMPSPRFWTFEDGAVNFGNVSAPAEDVLTSLIVDYALRYANDHYIVPIPLSIGSILRVESLVVTDTYGETMVIRPVAATDGTTGTFRLFEQTVVPQPGAPPVRDPLFVLLPTTAAGLSGAPLEQVDYARDDAAELVWAVENTALGTTGEPVDRTAEAAVMAAATPLPPPSADPLATLTYVPRTLVLNNWFPFLSSAGPLPPAVLASSTTVPNTYVTLADVPPVTGVLDQPPPLPWSRILGDQSPPVSLPQEEITGAGLRVTREWRYARWIDGTQLSWVRRVTDVGRGPASSGLKFDQAI